MNRLFKTALCSSVALAALAASVPAVSQEITASIRGSVVDTNGSAVTDVTVRVTHVASGSSRTFTTNNAGAFFARGLRPGGPYTVSVEATTDTRGQEITDIFLNLSEPLPLEIPVVAKDASVEEIEVTAQRIFALKTGGSSTYGKDQIAKLPSIGRDFKDTVRANPFVTLQGADNSLSIGGANNRFNNITLDGIGQDDSFGLNASGVPTQRSPISIETIEQVSVAVAPFGVESGGFTGGQLNVVTKSGTNEFHGSGFFHYRDDSLAGKRSKETRVDLGNFQNKFWGGTLGGPIIKDKLFFFAAYEKFQGTTPNTFGASDSGATNAIPGVTNADLAAITEAARSVYNYNTQGLNAGSVPETDEKIFAKIDWNINDDHRAFVSYQRTDGNSLRIQDTSVSRRRIGFLGHWYNRSETLNSYNFQLFSDWTDNLSTELKVGYTNQKTGQVSLSPANFGEAQVRTAGGATVFLGTDDSRHANRLNNKTWNVKAKADLVLGSHTFTAGYELNSVNVANLFIQRALGVWRFDSIEDFRNRRASSLSYQNAVTNNPEDGAAKFNISRHTFYLQDRFDVNDKLTLTAGLRTTIYQQNQAPNLNQNFVTRNGFANTATLDGKALVQPRFGFTYDFDETTTIRGGAGIFGGGDPNVWVSNAFSLDGVTISTFDARRRGNTNADELAVLNNADFGSVPQLARNALAAGNGNVAATDPNFKIPSVWKFNLAVERYFDFGPLGNDWLLTAEAIWTRTRQAANWIDLRRVSTGTAFDGTPIYSLRPGAPVGTDLLLTNASQGKSDVYAFSFSKSWNTGFSIFGSYTFQDVEVVNDGTSSTAGSNFRFSAYTDINNRQVGTSPFEVRHQIKLSATYQKDFWDDNTTTISLYYNGRSGRPYSSGFNLFGSRHGFPFGGVRGADDSAGHLIYIPTVAESAVVPADGQAAPAGARVFFASQDLLNRFNAFVDANGYTRGQSVSKQDRRGPWINELDLRIAQEVPLPFGKIEVFADMQNLLNFLNGNWGRVERSEFAQQGIVGLVRDSQGRNVYTSLNDPSFRFQDAQSVWRLQIGVKYKF